MHVDTDDLIDAGEVAAVLGLAQRSSVATYRRRHADFPDPVLVKAAGKCLLWLRPDVVAWRDREAIRAAREATEIERQNAERHAERRRRMRAALRIIESPLMSRAERGLLYAGIDPTGAIDEAMALILLLPVRDAQQVDQAVRAVVEAAPTDWFYQPF